ncbi:DUF5301 domain-containing protein [Anaerocolumna sp. AGMB13020]|uniref:DUF5301 domain-containing protein n=1 Tax=Anaerocolumna sp. AGMB13020 TaxID=3081750 RepID=UPI0029533EFB|nr:DUF5301 domain-containing protein [Anaerocolumna sp. AGMB13020]WOO39126.1 DUF5301 domain-containing protein [Anaerocolumna sp. AGMB13020]
MRFPNTKAIKTAAILLCLFVILLVIATSAGVYQRIILPDSRDVNVLYLSFVKEGTDKGSIEVKDKQVIGNILKLLAGARKSLQSSVQDTPLTKSYFIVNIKLPSENHILYLYKYKNSYYLEEPYLAVYKISKTDYKKLSSIYISVADPLTKDVETRYELNRMKYGKKIKTNDDLSKEEIELVEAVIQNGLSKSAAWQGKDIAKVDECYAIHKVFTDIDIKDSYYAYLIEDDVSVFQNGRNDYYNVLDRKLYDKLTEVMGK